MRSHAREVVLLLAFLLVAAMAGRGLLAHVESGYRDVFHFLRPHADADAIVLVTATPAAAAQDARVLANLIRALASSGAHPIVSLLPAPAPLSRSEAEQLQMLSALDAAAGKFGDDATDAQRLLKPQIARLRERAASTTALAEAARQAGNVFFAPAGEPADTRYVPGLAAVVESAMQERPRPAPGSARSTDRSMSAVFHRPPGSAGSAWPAIRADDLLAGRVPEEKLRNRVAVIEPADASLAAELPARQGERRIAASHQLAERLAGDVLHQPRWHIRLETAVTLLATLTPLLLAGLALPIIRGGTAALLAAALLGIEAYGVISHGIWLQLVSAAVMLLLSAAALEWLRSLADTPVQEVPPREDPAPDPTPEPVPIAAPVPSPQVAPTDALDQEFAALRQRPNNAATKAGLYDLAIRYVRVKQLAQAERVLRHLVVLDASYRDVEKKLARISALDSRIEAIAAPAEGSREEPALSGAEPTLGDRRKADRRQAEAAVNPDKRRRSAGRRLSDQLSGPDAPTLRRLGRYNLLRELGRGAMAHVYLAEDPVVRRQVAIKTLALADEFAESDLQSAREQFAREAQAAGRLNHRNIISIYDFGEEEGLSYIVMEYFPGKPTSAFVSAETLLPPQWVLDLCAQAADALQYAHDQNVIHRDIKPANLMYDPGADLLKVADFGIARLTDTKRTRSGIILGTPSYMAPEHFRGDALDGRADLYSLGVTAYQLLTGTVPFKGISIPKLLEQIISQPPEPVTSVRSDLPAAIDEVLGRALAKDPAARFENARAMAEALRACSRAHAA